MTDRDKPGDPDHANRPRGEQRPRAERVDTVPVRCVQRDERGEARRQVLLRFRADGDEGVPGARPGLGRLAYEGISSRDFPVIQAVVLVTAVIVAVVNLGVDCLYAVIDPRIRYAR